ncbi:MAG: LuxR C-terminal-related transcriptional regulator, partial [Novosphingobium sp.]|nr:LuxR C-terminal-related transcriptional regulator [Novosphingobium sp.]
EARCEAARIGLYPDTMPVPPRPFAMVSRNREIFFAAGVELCVAGGYARLVETPIAEETRKARADGRIARLVELTLTEAEIAVRQGNFAAGNRLLVRAVGLAAPRGIARPFDDHASMIGRLLQGMQPHGWGFALEQERRFFADLCARLPLNQSVTAGKGTALPSGVALHDTLTRRQVELLNLLAAGLSNQQIADRIHVSLSTVKGHLQKLYEKFDVINRSAAVARARELNLLK